MGLMVFQAAGGLWALGLVIYLGLNWRRARVPLGQAVRQFLAAPVFSDENDNRRASLLSALLQPVVLGTLLVVPVVFLLRPDETAVIFLFLGVWAVNANVSLYVLARHGHLRLACWLLPAVMFGMITLGLLAGTRFPGLATYLIVIVGAGLLLGGQGALFYALLSSLVWPAAAEAEVLGWIRPDILAPFTLANWLVFASVYVVTALLLGLAARRIEEGVRHADELRATQVAHNEALDRSLSVERQRARQLELLADSARQLTGLSDPQTLIDEAAHRLVEDFNFEHAAVFLVEEDELVLRAVQGRFSQAYPIGWRVRLGEGVAGWVGRSGEGCWVRDTSNDKRFIPRPGFEVACEVAVPLRLAKNIVGVLEVASPRPEAFEPADVRTLESLADLIAAGLQASQLFIRLRSRQQMTEALRQIGAAVNASLDLAQIADTVCAETRRAFEANRVEIWLAAGNSAGQMRLAGVCPAGSPSQPAEAGNGNHGAPAWVPEWLRHRLDQDGRVVLMVAGTGGPDIEQQLAQLDQSRSLILAPLTKDQQQLGVLAISETTRRQAFTAEEASAAELLGSHLAAAVANARALEAEKHRNVELEILHASSLRLRSNLDLKEVLGAILTQALQLAGGSDAHIFLYDGEQLDLAVAIWSNSEHQAPLATPRPGGLTESVAHSGQRIVIPAVDQDALYHDWKWGGAIVGLPLRSGERVSGVMNVAYERPRQFDEHELRLLELLADQAAAALENTRLFNSEREQRELAEALREASLALSGSLEFDAVLDRLLDQIERVVPFDAASILLMEAGGGRVRVARSRGYERFGPAVAEWVTTMVFDLESTPNLRMMAETLQPQVIADTHAYAGWRHSLASEAFHGWAGVPIVAHQQVMAFFALDKIEVGYYQPEHAARLEAFAGQAALALQNARLFETERRRAAQLTLLSEVSQQVTSTLDEAVLLQRVVEAMIQRLGFAEAAVLVPAGAHRLEVVALVTRQPMHVGIGFRQEIGAGVIGHAVETGVTYLTNDVGHDPYYFDPSGRTIGSAMALPLRREAKLLGVLYLETSTPNAFNTPDVVAFETLANHVATALDNARLYADASSRLREMTALQSVSQTIVASLDLDHIIESVVLLIHDTFGYTYVSLYELRGSRLHLKAQLGYPEELIIWDIPISSGVSGRAVRTRQTQLIRDVNQEPAFLKALYSAQSEICVPLIKDPDVLGMLNVETGPDRILDEVDVRSLSALAGQVTIAIDNARLFEAERHQRELAEVLRQTSQALSASLDFDTVLDRLLEQIGRLVPYDSGNIMLVEGVTTTIARQRGYEQFGAAVARAVARLVFDLGATPLLAQMIRTGQPLIVSDTGAEPGWIPGPAASHVRSWAGGPILAQGGVVALFSLDKQEAGFYQPEHAGRLAAFAGQAGLALENARLFAAQQRRAEELRLLLLAARDFSGARTEAVVLQAVVRHMSTALRASSCSISKWDPERDAVTTLNDYVPPANATGAPFEPRGASYSLADFPATRRVLETRQPLVVDAADPEADPAERALLGQLGQGAAMIVAVYTGDGVFGLVELYREAGAPAFSDADQQMAHSLAVQAAVALENAQLHAAVQENVRELDALLKANEALLSTLELDPLLHNILAAAIAAVPTAEKGTIILADRASEQLRVRAAYGYDDARVTHLAFPWEQGYAGKALRENRPLLVTDAGLEVQIKLEQRLPEIRAVLSAIVAPLVPKGAEGNADGVISLDANRRAAFTPADLRILVAFANTAAVAIENARLHAEVQRLAVTDSLTDLANPRAFEHALMTEAYRAMRYGHALSLIIMDIDSFKQYNDTYGHLAGNERLKAIAEVLRAKVRDPDLPARYGGEEFALLLPHTDKAGAIRLAERIREAAQAAAPNSVAAGMPAAGYTLSLGVATFPNDARNSDELLLAADNAELAAKRAGKNRVWASEALE